MIRDAWTGIGSGRVNPVCCGRKCCGHCGRWRLALDFPAHRRAPLRLAGICRACRRAEHDRRRADRQWLARRRAYYRENAAQARRKAGVLPRERWVAEVHSQASKIVCGRKFCTRCGRWRPVHDYPVRTHGGLYGRCYACERATQRERYAERRRDPVWLEQRREYERIYHEVKRREAGIPERRWIDGRPYPSAPTYWTTDAEPIRALVRQYGGSRSELALRAGLTERLLYRLMHENAAISVGAADRIAIACGLHLDLIAEGAGL